MVSAKNVSVTYFASLSSIIFSMVACVGGEKYKLLN